MAEPIPLDKPTRRTIETLFRDMLGSRYDDTNPDYLEYRRLEEAEEQLEEKLLSNPKLVKLKKQKERMWNKYHSSNSKQKEQLKILHRKYLANGITKELITELNKLIK